MRKKGSLHRLVWFFLFSHALWLVVFRTGILGRKAKTSSKLVFREIKKGGAKTAGLSVTYNGIAYYAWAGALAILAGVLKFLGLW